MKSLLRTRRRSLGYGLAFAFTAFFVFISNSSNHATTAARSHFSSIFSYFFLPPNAYPIPPPPLPNAAPTVGNATSPIHLTVVNATEVSSTANQSLIQPTPEADSHSPAMMASEPKPEPSATTTSTSIQVLRSNYTTSLLRKQQHQNQQTVNNLSSEETLARCDFYAGSWVRDDSYPLYEPGSCSLIDDQFNCIANGRPDTHYQKLKWKPHQCDLPRLDAKLMLKMLRGKKLAFVGDSLNRNMWESLVCILKSSVKDQTKVYEAHGRHRFRTAEASYSFIFKDYDLSVEFFVSPFLVREWEMPEKGGRKKETLRLDLMGESAAKYKGADILIFNTGHWWTHEKTSKGEDYYQEGNQVYDKLHVKEAFRKALATWARWVDRNVDPSKTMVFFRGYSESHFSGGRWNSGGQCHNETEPINKEKYLAKYPYKMRALEPVLRGMKTPVSFLNVTRMTDYRKDGHPSIYRKKQQHYSEEEKQSPLRFQDCSHWCLPGVPDTWNELLYAALTVREYQRRKKVHR